jgi:cytochrome c-type biogenesis protein CcmH
LPPKTQLEKDLYDSIICMCGTCGRRRIGDCTCGLAEQMRDEVSALVKQGMTRDAVLHYYVTKYGSEEPLAAPIDRGFNRLAWLVPYLLGLAGAVTAGGVACRWARSGTTPAAAAPLSPNDHDERLLSRLDDELGTLD